MNEDHEQNLSSSVETTDRTERLSIRPWLGRVGAGLGAIAAIIAIWQALPSQPDDERLLFRDETKNLQINSETQWTDGMQGAHVLSVSGGALIVPDGSVVSANHIRMQKGGRITGRRFAVLATTIEGGSIDSIGSAGSSGTTSGADGTPGQDGGSILAIAARISNTELTASGGNGGSGAVGQDGADGRNGRCDGFGKWVKANRGGDGGTGGSGGAGGSGGSITIFHSPEYLLQPLPQAQGGIGGTPGAGGRGGTGGRGCVGLGGSQSNAPNGRPGISGKQGPGGQPMPPDVKEVSFDAIVDLMHEQSNSPITMETIEDLIARVSR